MARWIAGPLGGEMTGRVGNAVLVRDPGGTILRDLPRRNDPQTPEQRAFRARQTRAARAWQELEPEAVADWTQYAPQMGMRPMNAFTTLYKVLLRLDPAAPVPLVPPARPFFGDVIEIGLSPQLPLHLEGDASGPVRTAFASPSSADPKTEPLGEGEPSVRFAASGANAAGVVTELLIQPLASRHRRTYPERYRHAAYMTFTGAETVAVAAPEGWVALAYRFVNRATGQVTALAELGVVQSG